MRCFNRLRVRKKRRINKIFLLLIVLIVSIFFSILLILKVENVIEDKMMSFCETQINKLSKSIVLEAVNRCTDEDINIDSLLIVEKNSDEQIESISLNTNKVNYLLKLINNRIVSIFNDIEKSNIKDLNVMTNNSIKINENGLVFEIPIGVITGSTFLSNIGPKIPIRIVFSEDLESEVKTEIENYGINNVLFKTYVEIKVSEQVLLPVGTRTITTINKIPIIVKMIQGDIPNYYFDKMSYND